MFGKVKGGLGACRLDAVTDLRSAALRPLSSVVTGITDHRSVIIKIAMLLLVRYNH